MTGFCVCDEEMCWCDNSVTIELVDGKVTDVACPECASGHHVWEMGGERDEHGVYGG